MTSIKLRQKFINFFKEKGHQVVPSASLVPENDPTVLFTTAGMHPLVPYLMGEGHPAGKRLCNVQKCIRTGDIDEVGDKTHCTFFEMLGYWSLGDYFKEEAIKNIYEFLTVELLIDRKNLAVTCFQGDSANDLAKDEEAAGIWRSLGIPDERIAFLGYEDNWWGPAGVTGPCGHDTEIFVWTGEGDAPLKYDPADKKWVEIGNNVFMQFNKNIDGTLEVLKQKNVDFGGGLERLLAYLEGRDNVYETDLFEVILGEIESISGKKYSSSSVISSEVERSFRVIADHIRAATFMINDGVVPSNKDRGYVLRRLIRRAIVKGQQLGIEQNFTAKVARKVFEIYNGVYFGSVISTPLEERVEKSTEKDLSTSLEMTANDDKQKMILFELEKEEEKFRGTLTRGLLQFKIIAAMKTKSNEEEWKKVEFTAEEFFNLYQSFGFPYELSAEEATRLNIPIENNTRKTFEVMLRNHQDLSRTASAGMFKGGLADAGEETTKLHTAAHLMLAALRFVLGENVYQKGSNITPERLRFDFSYPEKMTVEQIKQVEALVNAQIEKDLPVEMAEMSVDEAKGQGAMGVFDAKYGDKVKVYTVDDFSKEICGGPHANRTGELGHFKILKEESSSAGVRRIKAVLS
ncbi:MAG: alanine--tRNA ligase-related protein [Candidatus Berkelbacteria bacterium]